MKLLLLNYEFPPIGGGAGNATKNLAKSFANSGHDVLVITSRFADLKHKEHIDGYKILRIPSIRRHAGQGSIVEMLVFVCSGIWQSRHIIKNNKPDVVISFFSIPSGIIAYYINNVYQLPYVISLRGGDVPGFYASRLGLYQRLTLPFNKTIWKNALAIVANSNSLQELASKTAKTINRQVVSIPNGVDIDFFHPDEKKKENNKLNLLFSGRLCIQKRVDLVINALQNITQKYPEYRNRITFTVVGKGPLENELHTQVKQAGLEDIVTFINWLDKDALASEYQKADVFVIASSDEGMSNVVLEATASGLPIITTPVGGTDQLMDGNGFIVPFNDAEAFASRIIDLLEHPDLQKEMSAASRRVAERMSWQNTAKQYLDIITSSISKGTQPIEQRFDKESSVWGNKHKQIKTIIDWEIRQRKSLAINALQKQWSGKNATILEVGCGSGENIDAILSLGEPWTVTGIDISAGMIDQCKTKHKNETANFTKMDITTETPTGTYDAILLLGVVGYLKNNADVLKRLDGILKPGGILIVTYGNRRSPARLIRKLAMHLFDIRIIQKISGKTYQDVSGYFTDYSPKELSIAIPNTYIKQDEFGLCYTAGLFGQLSVFLNKFIEPILSKKDVLNLAMTKLVIYRKPQ